MSKPRWDSQSLNYLTEHYYNIPNPELCFALGRTNTSILQKAQKLGLKKNPKLRRLSRCEVLLDGSSETLYWIGFILADGHINPNGRLKVAIAARDYDHLSRLADYLDAGVKFYDGKYPFYELHVMDMDVIPTLVERFQIHSNKTYNPPKIRELKLSDTEIMALMIGFIDGDGSLDKTRMTLSVKCHSSWLDNLKFFSESLQRISGIQSKMMPHVLSSGYARWSITNSKLMTYLRNFGTTENLPILTRKWYPSF